MRGKLRSTKKGNKKLALTIVGLFFATLMYIPIHLARATNYEDPTRVENSIRILEIEPGNQFMINNGSSSNLIGDCDLITDKSIAGGYTRDVKITHVTMPEFISQVDQINGKYDIVVIGRQNDGLRTTFEGTNNNIYRDYSNPFSEKPDYIPENWTNDGNWPMTNGPMTNGETRWGNTYVESYSENDITDKRAKEILSLIDSKQAVFIDNDIFNNDLNNTKLAKNFTSKSNCKINHGDISLDNILTKYVSSSGNYNKRLKLQITKEPTSDDVNQSYGVKANRNLSIEYTVTNDTGTSQDIEANLYVDINGDSMYLSKEGISCDTNSNTVGAGATVNGTLNYNVADDFLGYLEWKVEILNKSTGVKRYKTGKLVYRQLKDQDDKTIRVLQITCPPGNTSTRYGDTEDCNNNISLANDTRIKTLLQDNNLKGYNIKIDEQTIDAFGTNVAKFNNDNQNYNSTVSDQEKKRYLNGKYDMLIIGFADAYGLNNAGTHEFTDAAITEIKYFIQTGQSVMFTHDTIPIVINTNSSEYLGSKKLGQAFRDCIGQARYKDEYNSGEKDIYKEVVIDNNNNITYEDKTILHDQLPNTSNVSYGYTDSILIQADSNGWNYNNKQPYVTTPREATKYNSKITKINSGVINEFPFVLGDISTAKTHTQWFQLNLEDEDVVPWYTINGDNQNQLWRNKVIDKYDARNNYYTYSKGNITYSGTGHSNNFTNDELKLFVNTIVKADRGANHAPNILCSIPREKLEENNYTNDASVRMDYNFNINASDIEKDIVKMHMTIDGSEVTSNNVDMTKLNSNKEFIVDTANSSRSALNVKIPASKFTNIGDSVTIKVEAEDIQGAKSVKTYIVKAVDSPAFVVKAELDKDVNGNCKLTKVDANGNLITNENGQPVVSNVTGNTIEVKKTDNVKVPYKISSQDFTYGDKNNYPQKELVLLIDTTINSSIWTDVRNGIQNNIINKLVGGSEDVRIKIIMYGDNVINMTSKNSNDYRDNLQSQLLEADNYINKTSSKSNLGDAIEKGIEFFKENNLPYSGKDFIIISSNDPTDIDSIENLSSKVKDNYNVITVDINKDNPIINSHNKLKQVHNVLGGITRDYFIDKPSEAGQTAHNNLGAVMNLVANSAGRMKYKTYVLNNVKLNFNLGTEIDSVKGLNKKDINDSADNNYYINCPNIKYVPKVDSNGNVICNNDKVCYEWYFNGQTSNEQDFPYNTNFVIKANQNAIGECEFELPNEATYEYIDSGVQGKTNIEETPILRLNDAVITHGVYNRIGVVEKNAILDDTGQLSFAKASVVTFGSNIWGMNNLTNIKITIDSKATISERPKAYRILSNGNLEKIVESTVSNDTDPNDPKIFEFNNFNGETYNNIVVLYSIKLNDSETEAASYQNKVSVDGNFEAARVKSKVKADNTKNNEELLPDLF